MSQKISEDNLILLLKDSKTRPKGFRLLVEIYSPMLYSVVRRMLKDHEDTNDILQNTFIKVWNSLDNFRFDCKIYTWIYRIAINEAIKLLNKNKIDSSLSVEDIVVSNSLCADDDGVSGSEIAQKLNKAMELLPEKQRKVFYLKYFLDLKYEEISRQLDTSVGALKASFHHAVKKIEEFLTNQ